MLSLPQASSTENTVDKIKHLQQEVTDLKEQIKRKDKEIGELKSKLQRQAEKARGDMEDMKASTAELGRCPHGPANCYFSQTSCGIKKRNGTKNIGLHCI